MTNRYNEMVEAQETKAEAMGALVLVTCTIVGLFAALGLLPVLGSFELGLTFNLMMDMFGPEVPGAGVPATVWLMSLATMIAIIGHHLLHYKFPESRALALLDKSAPIMVLFFFIGIVALYALSEVAHVPGADAVAFDDDLFDAPPPESGGIGETIASYFGLFAGLSLGGLAIVNLAVMNFIVGKVREKLPRLLNERRIALAKLKASNRIIKNIRLLSATKRERVRLEAKTPDDMALEAAAEIEAALAPTLRELNKVKVRGSSATPKGRTIFARRNRKLPQPMPQPAFIDDFVADVTAKLGALRDELNGTFN